MERFSALETFLICTLLILLGVVLPWGSLDLGVKITDILSAIGTVAAVVVALWTTRLNVDRDRALLRAELMITPQQVVIGGGFVFQRKVVDAPKAFLIIINEGLRPIALKRIQVQFENGNSEDICFMRSIMEKNTVIQPGNFLKYELSQNQLGGTYESAIKRKYRVVDVLGGTTEADIVTYSHDDISFNM